MPLQKERNPMSAKKPSLTSATSGPSTKKITVPKIRTAPADPQETRLAYYSLAGSEVLTVDELRVNESAIISALAAKVGGNPWLWTVATDHVSIIMTTGQKYRFDRHQ
jgi:hypothetical protein